jgi:RND family efflux transporter MFP subunit
MENGSRPEEIEQARARMEAAKARMDYAKIRLQRLQSLYRQGRAASIEEVDEATSASDAAHNSYLEAVAGFDLVQKGPRAEQKAQAAARLAAADALVKRLEDQIQKHTIISRFNGYVSAEHTEVGQWVNRGDPVAEVVALDEVDIQVHVVEDHVPHLTKGMAAPVEAAALAGRKFAGTVALIVPQADARTRTFPVKVRVKNEKREDGSPLLMAGMLARVTLPVGARQEGTMVPKDALVLDGPRRAVWVVDPATAKTVEESGRSFRQGLAKSVPVETGAEEGSWVLIRGEVKPGQLVVTRANERIFVPIVKWVAPGAESPRTAKVR